VAGAVRPNAAISHGGGKRRADIIASGQEPKDASGND